MTTAINETFEILCKGTTCLLTLYQCVVFIVVPAQCMPLYKLWDFTGQVPGRCINANAFYHGEYTHTASVTALYLTCIATSAFHIVMDLWILVLPMKLIMRIPRPPREKIALYVIFCLGIMSTLASIIRLQSLRIFTLSDDPFYDSLPINTWSMVEINVGILCASIPTLRPLVSKAQRYRTKHALMQYDKRKNTLEVWPGDHKGLIVKPGQDLLISLHPSTLRSRSLESVDEEWKLDDRPPPVPPKDNIHCSTLSQPLRYPDMSHMKI